MGIETTAELLAVCAEPSDRAHTAKQTGVEPSVLDEWASYAGMMQVRGVGERETRLLRATGVEDVHQLSASEPRQLYRALREQARKTKWRGKRLSEKKVARWIELAGEF
jgi:nucleotidyltransferase/DNA polymerase involved in DNA repair